MDKTPGMIFQLKEWVSTALFRRGNGEITDLIVIESEEGINQLVELALEAQKWHRDGKKIH